MVACIQPHLSSGEAVGLPRIPDRPGSWRFVLDGLAEARPNLIEVQTLLSKLPFGISARAV